MTISKELAKFPNKADANNLDSVHLNLAIHIANQNKLRSDYFKDLVLGDPIWDILLDIYISEEMDRPTTVDAISDRQDKSHSLCRRCVTYLLEHDAVFENRNQYTAQKFSFLASDKTKLEIAAWLNNCLAKAPQF